LKRIINLAVPKSSLVKIKIIALKVLLFIFLVGASLFVAFVIQYLLSFIQDIVLVHPDERYLVFRSYYLLHVSNFIIIISFLAYSLRMKKLRKGRVVRYSPFWLKFLICLFTVGMIVSFSCGINSYIAINKVTEEITVSSGMPKRKVSTYSLDEIKVLMYKVRISSGRYGGGRTAKFNTIETPGGERIWNINRMSVLVPMLDKRKGCNLVINPKEPTTLQDVVANYGNLLNIIAFGYTPLLLSMHMTRKLGKKPARKETKNAEFLPSDQEMKSV
jgi:hypothetical protein